MTDTDEALADLRVKVKTIDAGLLGRRIRHARQRAGLTQGDAAGTDMSTAYISRIEAGQRRPAADLLIALADRLRCTPEELLAPDDSVVTYDAAVVARLTLELDYADLELRTGSADRALERVEEVLAEARRTTAVPAELRGTAELLQGRALEAVGRVTEALDRYEAIVAGDADPMRLIQAFTSLSRCYSETNDYARAADVGERAAAIVGRAQLDGTAEGLKLAVTVAAAHFERGDANHAVRLCERALLGADAIDSPEARAAAYWNTSIMESRQGRVDSALPLAAKALSILEVAEDARSQTRLRVQLGLLNLRSDPPRPEEALEILRRADRDGASSELNAADRSRIKIGIARAQYLLDDVALAEESVHAALEEVGESSSLLEAEALILRGQIAVTRGHGDDATASYRAAASRLSTLGGDRGVASLWFDLGSLLSEQHLYEEAAHAFRAAGSTTGLGSTGTRRPVSTA